MYVMKDSPSVISIGRLVIDDGYDLIWKHRDRQAVLISLKGERHNLWNDMYTPMLAVQTSQDFNEPNNGFTDLIVNRKADHGPALNNAC
jgi:hypothetical protein